MCSALPLSQVPSTSLGDSGAPLLSYVLIFFLIQINYHLIIETNLELPVFLPWPPKCWDYGQVPPCPATPVGETFLHNGCCDNMIPKTSLDVKVTDSSRNPLVP